ncbi:phage holin [Virgibacillus dokdonensis]|uniref:Phage holin n=1 Tax=Virgibacillus dokdonensis TaxID=302167 RepID=A0A2K9IX10_9BACI|nr:MULTISPECIES: phage holin [Virgibacillus]AUJ24217.1 Phage lysis protein, holin [Virgibacillus dokdonensis]NWO12417.1 phage holin [Virgibacillus sp.]RFA33991.1 phage holin [Virgibacillus dokdonensis]
MDKGTVVRTIALAIVWVNAVLVNYNLQPIPLLEEEVIAYGVTFIVSVWTWFKNNYITLRGRQQKEVLQRSNLTK